MRLTTTYTTVPGSNRLVIHDVVENRSAQPAEMQLLYHCNLGPPFLEAGSRVLAPIREMAPLTPRAAEGIDTYETYAGPAAGFAEQVYVYDLLADPRGHTLAVLVNARRTGPSPCASTAASCRASPSGRTPARWRTATSPAWSRRRTIRTSSGFERQQGRVRVLPPGGRWESRWSLEVADTSASVSALLAEVATLQAHARAVVHREPDPILPRVNAGFPDFGERPP